MEKQWQVWQGALAASRGGPSRGDKWVDCEVLETKEQQSWIKAGSNILWVSNAHLRTREGEGIHRKYTYLNGDTYKKMHSQED